MINYIGGKTSSMANLTQKDVERLLSLLKETVLRDFQFPNNGGKEHCEVNSIRTKDKFIISVYRGKYNPRKYDYTARVKGEEVILMLHITPSGIHPNPGYEIIKGSHWHVYSPLYGLSVAYPAEDINDEEFVENTIKFLDRFNVIKKPNVIYNTRLTEDF